MGNPWNEIDLNEYEKHMQYASVMQLQTLNKIIKKQLGSFAASTAILLGVAGGNGLEHLIDSKISKLYAVDINKEYLNNCKNRFPNLDNYIEYLCKDCMSEDLILPHADLVIADLFIEYIGYDKVSHLLKIIKPKYVSCAIQVNRSDEFVSDSPYIHTFDHLEEILQDIDELTLTESMLINRFKKLNQVEYALPNGKSLLQIDFALQP